MAQWEEFGLELTRVDGEPVWKQPWDDYGWCRWGRAKVPPVPDGFTGTRREWWCWRVFGELKHSPGYWDAEKVVFDAVSGELSILASHEDMERWWDGESDPRRWEGMWSDVEVLVVSCKVRYREGAPAEYPSDESLERGAVLVSRGLGGEWPACEAIGLPESGEWALADFPARRVLEARVAPDYAGGYCLRAFGGGRWDYGGFELRSPVEGGCPDTRDAVLACDVRGEVEYVDPEPGIGVPVGPARLRMRPLRVVGARFFSSPEEAREWAEEKALEWESGGRDYDGVVLWVAGMIVCKDGKEHHFKWGGPAGAVSFVHERAGLAGDRAGAVHRLVGDEWLEEDYPLTPPRRRHVS